MRWLRQLKSRLPEAWRLRMTRLRRPRSIYLLFPRCAPLSRFAGRERGQPIDRLYIESFLAANAALISGRCLEVKDDLYTKHFGGDRVRHCDILDINPDNPLATVRGDLRRLDSIADHLYDCFILTQTLQYLDDLDAAIGECHRILKPGGVLLATLPCLGKMEGLEPNVHGNFWRFTPHAARYLFAKRFAVDQIEVNSHGNALAGMAFWIGLAQEDLPRRKLLEHDPAFPVIVTVRAIKT